MSQADKMKSDIIETIKDYNMTFAYLKDLSLTLDDLDSMESKPVFDKAPNFMEIAKCGIIDSLMLAYARLYDNSNQARTIPQLIERCISNSNLFDNPQETMNMLSQFKIKLESDEILPKVVETIKMRRDKYLVHNDPKFFGSKVANDQSYLPNYALWELMNFSEEVLKYLSDQLGIPMQATKHNKDLFELLDKPVSKS